ncbi:MAG: hypothetical protein A2Y95_12950 [Deltaproteobacteria bacterium RBG_13_65_10]|nr:MAG: hypothetical protein A2Y95_12950 [Deltaproteobacteria bacterium RBG_13_65_10]
MAFNQDMKALVPGADVDADYLLYAMIARKHALVSQIGTSAHGTRRMGSASIAELLLPLPRSDEQGEIARALRSIEEREERVSDARSALNELFDAMLQSLMTGRIRMKDQDLRPPEAHAP